MKTFISVCVLMLALGAPCLHSSTYYYGDKGPVILNEVDSLVVVRLSDQYSREDWSLLTSDVNQLDKVSSPRPGVFGYDIVRVSDRSNLTALIDTLVNHEMVAEALPVYASTSGALCYPNNQLVVKIKDKASENEARLMLSAPGLKIVSESSGGIIVLQTTDRSRSSALEAANRLYETGLFKYAHPDLVVYDFLDFTPNDTYFPNQYYLKNSQHADIDIDAETAWEITTGVEGIVVAVLDDGIQDIHEDLNPSKFTAGYDFVDRVPTAKSITGCCSQTTIPDPPRILTRLTACVWPG